VLRRPRHRAPVSLYAVFIVVVLSMVVGVGTASASRVVTFAPAFSPESHLGEGATLAAALTITGTEYHGGPGPEPSQSWWHPVSGLSRVPVRE
jgi:hypothetical protein